MPGRVFVMEGSCRDAVPTRPYPFLPILNFIIYQDCGVASFIPLGTICVPSPAWVAPA